MTAPIFGSTPCRACGGTGHIRGLEGSCNACGGDGMVAPKTTPSKSAPLDHDRHDTYLLMAARTLSEDGYIKAFDAVYHQRCSCGVIRNNTRLAATVHTLRHRYGWDIETRIPEGRALAVYELVEEGTWPTR